MSEETGKPINIVMGSRSDWPTMINAVYPLEDLGIAYQTGVVSAHRTPDRLYEFAKSAEARGVKVIIAGAGGSAHLPGMLAAITPIPVIAVPIKSGFNDGLDSLLSIVQMPKGVAVATQAVGDSGAYNAGVLAAQMLAIGDVKLKSKFVRWRTEMRNNVPLEVE